MKKKHNFRSFQLAALGWVAILLAPLVWLSSALHGFDFPQSISETGTMPNTVSFLLPVALGALALFSLSYGLKYSYSYILDKVLPICMFIGFLLVALFPTASPYITQDKVGIIPMSQICSHRIHVFGALVGFGAMVAWILVCFTKSNRPKEQRTKQKRYRNIIYHVMGYSIVVCLVIFLLAVTGQLQPNFALVYWLEAVILGGAGFCCLVKSGMFLKDKRGESNERTEV